MTRDPLDIRLWIGDQTTQYSNQWFITSLDKDKDDVYVGCAQGGGKTIKISLHDGGDCHYRFTESFKEFRPDGYRPKVLEWKRRPTPQPPSFAPTFGMQMFFPTERLIASAISLRRKKRRIIAPLAPGPRGQAVVVDFLYTSASMWFLQTHFYREPINLIGSRDMRKGGTFLAVARTSPFTWPIAHTVTAEGNSGDIVTVLLCNSPQDGGWLEVTESRVRPTPKGLAV